MLIDLTHVLKTEEKVIQKEVVYTPDTFSDGTTEFPIISKTPVSLTIKNMGNQELQIAGRINVTVLIPCGRCLEDVKDNIELDFEKEVDMKLSTAEKVEAMDEQNYINGYNLDVDKLVYDELLVNWPMKVLCSEDCKGLCGTCGTNLNLQTCDCERTDSDPRMARIRDIFSKFKEV